MCGVAGLIYIDGSQVDLEILKLMTDAIAHRGPDGEGHWIENNIGIGHRRLSIIDLTTNGQQPMVSEDKRYVLSYNGEIYNYKELRREIEYKGSTFKSNSDSEVVLKSIIAWGSKAFEKFNGMFALAFWDRKEQSLLLARDRYGIKPLYILKQNNVISFASEQKAILKIKKIKKNINKESLVEYFTFQNIFTNNTLLDGMSILPAGSYTSLCLRNQSEINNFPIFTRYWDFNFCEEKKNTDIKEYEEELSRLFQQAVKRQLVSDVEIGSYLSGGIDSGSITAIASKLSPYIKTFTCGFDLSSASGIELAYDERIKAEAISAIFKTEHYEMVLKAGDMERAIKKLCWHLEEPRIGQSYPNFYAAKLASKFVKVVLSGVGGDELFGGYPWRYYKSINAKSFENYSKEYYKYWQRLLKQDELKDLFNPIWNDVKDVNTNQIFRNVFLGQNNRLSKPEDFINLSLYFEAKTFLHGLLVVEDKLSMAHGLETRLPFLDNDLVNFAMKCPVNLKIKNMNSDVRIDENETGGKKEKYFIQTKDGKMILREMMRNVMPFEITNGIKQGFSAPDASWFKGESIDYVRNTLINGTPKINDYFDKKVINKLVSQHTNGEVNRRLLIWSLISFEQYLNNL